MNLPQPIRDFILALTDDTLSPAYLLVNETKLSKWGGEIESYGVVGLHQGLDVGEHISFLTGILPLGEGSVFLPRVQTKPGVFADLYLFGREEGTWVLLLDATADSARRRTMQQNLYDSRLQATDLRKESKGLLEANVVLEELVRERTADLMQTILQLKQQLAENQRARKASPKD
jgi:hypothetical protein